MLWTGRLKQRPARDAPVCSHCVGLRDDLTPSGIPWRALIPACTFSGDITKKHTTMPHASLATAVRGFRSVCTLF